MNLNNLGYYIYKDKIYSKRLDAFEAINQNHDFINPDFRLWFHDDIFSQYDWTIEPEESIDELYKKQAQYLRSQYDYLILSFSGGADSHNVLRSFIDNGIHLDEVHTSCSFGLMKVTDHDHDSLLKEYNSAVLPRLSRLAKYHPEIKVKIWDSSKFIENNFKSFNFIEDNKEALSVSQCHYNGLKEIQIVTDQNKYVESLKDKKVGIIWGHEKPCFTRINNHLMLYFTDLGRVPPLFSSYDLLYEPVMFYYHPNAARMMIKQSHLFKRELERNPALNKLFRDQTYGSIIKESVWMEKLLYPTTFEDVWQQNLKFRDDNILKYSFGAPNVHDIINDIWKGIKSRPHKIKSHTIDEVRNFRYLVRSKYYDIGPIKQISDQ